jgi:glycosyltransferase involved in cell wall biosynthesis
MRILFVADGRSPTALNWIGGIIQRGHEVHLVSTFACQPNLALVSLNIVPVAFSGLKGSADLPTRKAGGAAFVKVRTALRQWFGPVTIPRAAQQLRTIIQAIQPDLVHAMRIPYEGMVAALALSQDSRENGLQAPPVLVSVWGNDFTLHAAANRWMRQYTHLALQRANGLHADCHRDIRYAHAWGFDRRRPTIVLPGGGGIQLDIFTSPAETGAGSHDFEEINHPGQRMNSENSALCIINPRGVRAYVRNQEFFQAIPLVLAHFPTLRVLCPGMAGEKQVIRWVRELGIEKNVDLLPSQPRSSMADLYRQSQVTVSPSTHDGTPNTLLEAMACGCLPVAGDLESIREWITPGINGLLVDPADVQGMAQAILSALENEAFRLRAMAYNQRLVAERAEFGKCILLAEQFYTKFKY